jgi:hypothetical protein
MEYRLTRDEDDRFHRAYAFVAASKHLTPKDTEFEAAREILGDLPIDAVEEAAKTLAQEAGAWMPSGGDWYEVADNLAVTSLVASRSSEVAQLTAGRHLENEEQAATRKARDAFVSTYEALSGRRLPAEHLWKSDTPEVAAYACPHCEDTGWQRHECVAADLCTVCRAKRHLYDHDYADRCVCFATNPVLQAARAHTQQRERTKHNKRGY